MSQVLKEPLTSDQTKKLLVAILVSGVVQFTGHARREMAGDGITEDEVIGVLRGGVVEPAEFENDRWRCRVRRTKTYVVVQFASSTKTLVVTAWRKK